MTMRPSTAPFVGQRCRWGRSRTTHSGAARHGAGWRPDAHPACGGGVVGGSPSLTPVQQADPSPPGGSSSSLPTSQPLSSVNQQTPPPGTPLVSDQHFYYNLTRAGEAPVTETGSRQLTWTTSDLRQLDGTEDTGARDDFNTVASSPG